MPNTYASPLKLVKVRRYIGAQPRPAPVFGVRVHTYRVHYNSTMPRRASIDIGREAGEALASALGGLGIAVAVSYGEHERDSPGPDFIVGVDGQQFVAEVKTVVTAAQGDQLAQSVCDRHRPVIVVAQRIASDAKRVLRHRGVNFFDMRGELRIVDPPLIIDTRLPAISGTLSAPVGPLESQVAKEVAIACLLTPDQRHGVRQLARQLARAPSAVSAAVNGLRSAGLLTSAGEPMLPDLFHELLSVWRRRPVPLAGLPDPTPGRSATRLGLGLDDVDSTTGWALTDTLAAASWGIPIVARGDHPPDFYVPSQAELRAAQALLGGGVDAADRACTVAVAPARMVCRQRFDHSGGSGRRWPVVSHIVAALDIAQDTSRGLEALSEWQTEGIVRAW